MSSTYSSYRG
jgi:hypothetical protein